MNNHWALAPYNKQNKLKQMKNKAAFPGQYIQGQGALNELPNLIKLFGKNGLILGSKSIKDNILPAYGAV